MIKPSDIEHMLPAILETLGVRALGDDVKVRMDPCSDMLLIRLALPKHSVAVKIDVDAATLMRTEEFCNLLLKELDRGQRMLFRAVIDHIAKHDRSPIDRVKEIEAAAAALLNAVSSDLGGIQMTYDTANRVLSAAYQLRQLIEHKMGAASWERNGYGPDPVVTEEHP